MTAEPGEWTRGWSASTTGKPLIRDFHGPDHADQWRAWTRPGAEGELWWAVRCMDGPENPNAPMGRETMHSRMDCSAEFPCDACVEAAQWRMEPERARRSQPRLL